MSATATSVYELVSGTATNGLEEFTTLFAYEGFNPEMIHAHFAKIINDDGITDQDFANDMRALITLGAMKGNYTLRNAGKISDAGKTKADGLYKKYKLKQGSLMGDKKAIILPRVLSAFPELTTKVILKVAPRDFGNRTSRLPKFMKNPVFPSLIPKSLDSSLVSTLLWLYTVYSADQSIVISSEKNFEDAFANQKKYVTIAFNSSVPSEAVRISMFKAQIDDIVRALTDHSTLTVGEVPSNRVVPSNARTMISSLSTV